MNDRAYHWTNPPKGRLEVIVDAIIRHKSEFIMASAIILLLSLAVLISSTIRNRHGPKK